MQIWPAIDLRGGKCVRLQQGDYQRETVFGDDPAAMARHWVDQGARRLHLVDLDGARDGRRANLASVRAIVAAVDIPCQLGGGIRSDEAIEEMFAAGVERLVVGTMALKDPEWFRRAVRTHRGRLALGIDARDGRVATDGWLETSEVLATDLAASLSGEPLAAIIYTDIDRDGMLAGPNLAALDRLREATELPIIASGGITRIEDISNLAQRMIDGCIIGRALYEGTLKLAEAIRAAGDRAP